MAYRKVESRIWNDAKFRALSDDGKLVFLMLLTHPHMTGVGAMRATLAGLAAEIEWLPERFRKAFETLLQRSMVEADERASLVALPNFLKHNPPANPNVVKGWIHALELLPECSLKQGVINRCINHIETNSACVREGLREWFAKQSRIQEQEQEQDLTLASLASSVPASHAEQVNVKTVEASNRARGMRLGSALGFGPDDEMPVCPPRPEAWTEWAMAECRDLAFVSAAWERFVDHFRAAPGQKGVKVDWEATWRNWLRGDMEKQGRRGNGKQAALEQRNAESGRDWQPPEDRAVEKPVQVELDPGEVY